MPADHALLACTGAALAGRSVAADAYENMAALTLDERGMICNCNPACETLFNYPRSELVWQHVSALLPQLAELQLTQHGQPNPRLRFLCHAGQHFMTMRQNGRNFASKLFFNSLDGIGQRRTLLIVRPVAESPGKNLRRSGGGVHARE